MLDLGEWIRNGHWTCGPQGRREWWGEGKEGGVGGLMRKAMI